MELEENSCLSWGSFLWFYTVDFELSKLCVRYKKMLTLALENAEVFSYGDAGFTLSPHATCILVHAGVLITLKHTQTHTYTPPLV